MEYYDKSFTQKCWKISFHSLVSDLGTTKSLFVDKGIFVESKSFILKTGKHKALMSATCAFEFLLHFKSFSRIFCIDRK